MTDGGRLVFALHDSDTTSISSTSSYDDGKWHHVAATLGASGMRLYVEGEVIDSGSSSAADPITRVLADRLEQPRRPTPRPTSHYFAAQLAYATVYNSSLSPTVIAAHYHAGS